MNLQDILLQIVSPIVTVVLGGGWFITYKAYKRKNNAEAVQAEAESWKSQQEVYQRTINDLKGTCEYIAKDRDELRKENDLLRERNNALRTKILEMDDQILTLKEEISRLGRRVEALSEKKNKS